MNITLSADEKLIEKARAAARARGTTLNQLVREYLSELAGQVSREAAVQEFLRVASEVKTNPEPGWKFNREEIHDRGHGR